MSEEVNFINKFTTLNKVCSNLFFKKGKLYQAAYDFNAEDDSELSMKRGDVVRVTETSDPNWWTGKILFFIFC